jgi:hypothetical protein
MSTTCFIDTSILCNLLPVPGRDQSKEEVREEFRQLKNSRTSFVLPVTTIIETGNHIAQLSDGHERRTAADTLTKMIKLMTEGKAPWRLHSYHWDSSFLRLLVEGVDGGPTLVEQAMAQVGCGDLCILAERRIFADRTGLRDVTVWTLDQQLAAYAG